MNCKPNCKNDRFVSVEASLQSSYGVPEGQPQCKTSPLRKEIQDVALKKSKTACVCAHVYVHSDCEGERRVLNSTHMHAYVLILNVSVCMCVWSS